MTGKFVGTLWIKVIITITFILLCSCTINETDKLLKEAHTFINRKDLDKLIEQLDSDDISVNVKAMAEFARFSIVIEELEKHRKDMSVKQLEKFLLIMALAEEKMREYSNDRSAIPDPIPESPYVGKRPLYSIYEGIGQINTKTRDVTNHTVTVVLNLGFDQNDTETSGELLSRRLELRDFVRRYFTGKYASELVPENEDRLKRDIMEQLNTRFLDQGRVRIVLFKRLDVMEVF